MRVRHPLYQDNYLYRLRRFNDAELLFTNSYLDSLRMELLIYLNIPVTIWYAIFAYYSIAFIAQTDSFTFYRVPDLRRIEYVSSYETNLGIPPTFFLLWSAPVFALSFFLVRCSDNEVYRSLPFFRKRYDLCRPLMNPDPSPGVDLLNLTPIPVRRIVHKRKVRASRFYDAPRSIQDFDIPIPSRPISGDLKWTALPPVPEDALVRPQRRSRALSIRKLPKAKLRKVEAWVAFSEEIKRRVEWKLTGDNVSEVHKQVSNRFGEFMDRDQYMYSRFRDVPREGSDVI